MQAAFARPDVVSWARGECFEDALTPRVCATPEDDCAVFICGIAQNLVQLYCEAVQVTNVQRAKVAMEGIVEQRLVDAEVHRWMRLGSSGSGTNLRPRRPLGRRCALLGVGERRSRIRRVRV
jgi:hypothetical protein